MKTAPREAVALLERYVHLFPHGSLLPEAEFMRIEAACALGEETMVEKLRASFAARWPDSPLTVRAAEICVP